jgi:hypothetical protein
MQYLPYIDEHRIRIGATRDHVWGALISVLRTQLDGNVPKPLARLLGLTPAELRGGWYGTLSAGDSLPGFEVAESQAPARLALRGEHRFSRYALVFELDATGAADCTLCARSWAAFPGLAGRGYRAIVIGTGGHRLVVRRLLRIVARRA